MTNLKKLAAGAALSAIAMGAVSTGAEAGGKGKFRGHFGFYKHHYGYKFIHNPYYEDCWYFKNKYFKTGKKYWLYKYHQCRHDW